MGGNVIYIVFVVTSLLDIFGENRRSSATHHAADLIGSVGGLLEERETGYFARIPEDRVLEWVDVVADATGLNAASMVVRQ